MTLTVLVLTIFPAAMAFAAVSDLLTMRISNNVSIALVVGFALIAALSGLPLEQIGRHVSAGAVVLAVCFFFFARGWIGGGDAKLAASTALWFGWGVLLDYLLVAAVFGGVLTLALLQVRRWPLPAALSAQGWIARLHAPTTGVPYGIALASAGLWLYPQTVFVKALGL